MLSNKSIKELPQPIFEHLADGCPAAVDYDTHTLYVLDRDKRLFEYALPKIRTMSDQDLFMIEGMAEVNPVCGATWLVALAAMEDIPIEDISVLLVAYQVVQLMLTANIMGIF